MEDITQELLQEQKIKVYIKINDENEITAINSSVFIDDTQDFIEIDSGFGDKYAHAQNNYLSCNILDIMGRYNYKYIRGEIVKI